MIAPPSDDMPDDARVALAVDIGGTKMAAGFLDVQGRILARHQVPTEGRAGAEELFADLLRLLDALEPPSAPAVVCGVGCGGPMTSGGNSVSPVNIPAWRGFPLRARLAEATGLEVVVDNDAKALTLAEGWRGAASNSRNFLGMVVSTGVGGGIVLDGHLLDGTSGNAGHIGHVIVEPGGRSCGCGARGCLEAEASGTAIAKLTGRPAAEAPIEVVERVGTLVGRAIASVANLLDLRLAVVAGSVALGYGRPFFTAAQYEIDDRARLEFSRGTVVRPAALGADAPLVGAGAVAWRHLGLDIGLGRPMED